MAILWKSNIKDEKNSSLPVETKSNQTVMANTPNINDVNRIAANAKFIGDMATENDIRIDGSFEGRLFSEARVVVGEKAVVKGDIFATLIDFSGTMLNGAFYAKDTLSLKTGCTVEGDLFFQRFQVELDAKFTGKCQVMEEPEFRKLAAPIEGMLRKAK